MNRLKLRIYTLTAMIAAICVVGSMVKIPTTATSTAALDSAPAFLSVVFLPPLFAGIAGLLGHFATALTSGFLLGPFHIIIAAEMFIVVFIFGWLHKKGMHILKWIFALVGNGILAPLPFYFLISPAFYVASVPGLLVATAINLVIVAVVMPVLSKVFATRGVQTS